ncbi:hypothetical protein PSP6_410043 [Paraburkholderia tropica]|nr:hypothetical protein PSP6_410043 [Paraburkholderia tropica]
MNDCSSHFDKKRNSGAPLYVIFIAAIHANYAVY